jgi:predicted RNA binding protein YcfA (HicA-like mRNA interferase family)
MPSYGPISRRALIRALRKAGFDGPFGGGRHEYMLRGAVRVIIPNLHGSDIGLTLLRTVLEAAGITRDEWERL